MRREAHHQFNRIYTDGMSSANAKAKFMKIGIVTLGCDKNTVDSEYFAGILAERGHRVFVPDEMAQPDAVVINTCGFIESAREESIRVILEWAAEKEHRRLEKNTPLRLFVVGCLAQRYLEELKEALREVDGFLGVGRWRDIPGLLERCSSGGMGDMMGRVEPPVYLSKSPDMSLSAPLPRRKLDRAPHAFLKIADGCSRKCSFCAIPRIKGPRRSVPKEILLEEARGLLRRGVREINIIAQDVAGYGRDLYPDYSLCDLLEDILAFSGKYWLRLLYLYPSDLNQRLLEIMMADRRLCPYLDIPLQHLSPGILRSMKRPADALSVLDKLSRWRKILPDLAIRSTFIVGFPGESKGDFRLLLEESARFRFDRLGAFLYSPEEGTRAFVLPGRIPVRTARRRLDRLMTRQAAIALKINTARVGGVMDVLVEDFFPEEGIYVGRTCRDAPDVDGVVLFSSPWPHNAGSIVPVRITGAKPYDLIGEAIK